ncbi:MAG: helix-turn-helix transcriptional regulator [Clostridia bacterium]|nr:helix-turn-helix transcriptional regulator [Clostridia bacterium]
MEFITSIGDVLKKYRSQSHLTQVQLAEEMGVTKNTYYNWENGKASPNISQLRYLCNKFSIPAHEILSLPSPANLEDDEERMLEVYRDLTLSEKRLAMRLLSQIQENEKEHV